MNSDKVFFISDEPKKSLEEGDAFDHQYYSRTLKNILEKTDSPMPYVIGLFGQWGVGKTGIINELQRILEEDKTLIYTYKFCKLDAWEYSESAFRREFLLDVAFEFDYLSPIEDELTNKGSSEDFKPREFDKQKYGHIIKQLGFLSLAVIIGMSLPLIASVIEYFLPIDLLGGLTPLLMIILSVLFATVAAISLGIMDNIKGMFKFQKVTNQFEPPVHADQFKKLFKRILKNDSDYKNEENYRVVIVLDNLDRCAENTVMAILNSVKTFLKTNKCVYILPCDDVGLKEHIIHSRTGENPDGQMSMVQANEYLRKYFQTTLTIRPILSEDLYDFTDKILNRLKIFDIPYFDSDTADSRQNKEWEEVKKRNREEVGVIFRVAIWSNPRRIIQLANKLTTNFLLTHEIKSGNPNLALTVLKQLGFLSKVTVIEEEWPQFYSELLKYPEMLVELHSYFQIESVDEQKIISRDEDLLNVKLSQNESIEVPLELEGFLRRTNPIHSDDVAEFLKLKQSSTRSNIRNYRRFEEAAVNRDVDYFQRAISDKKTDVRSIIYELLQLLDKYLNTHRDSATAFNIISSLESVYIHAPTKGQINRQVVSSKILDAMQKKSFEGYANEIGIEALFMFIEDSGVSQASEKIINRFIHGIKGDDLKFAEDDKYPPHPIISLLSHSLVLTPENKRQFKKRITEISEEEEEYFIYIMDTLEHSDIKEQNLVEDLIPQEFYKKVISSLTEVSDSSLSTLSFVIEYVKYFSEETIEFYFQMLTKLCETAEANENVLNLTNQLILKMISRFPLEQILPNATTMLVQQLAKMHNTLNTTEDRLAVSNVYLSLLPILDGAEQELYHDSLLNTVNMAEEDTLSEIIEAVRMKGTDLFEFETISEQIMNRIAELITDKDLRLKFYKLAVDFNKKELISNLVSSVWGTNDEDLDVLEEAKSKLTKTDFSKLVDTLMDASNSIPDDKVIRNLECLGSYGMSVTKIVAESMNQKILNKWLKSDTVNGRNAGKMCWQGIRQIDENIRNEFHKRLLGRMETHIEDETIISDLNRIIAETLVEDYEFLSKSHEKTFVATCLSMIEKERPDAVRDFGHELIQNLAPHPVVKRRIVERILKYLKLGHREERNLRNSLNTLQSFLPMTEGVKRRLKAIRNETSNVAVLEEYDSLFED